MKWGDFAFFERSQLFGYDTFIDLGKGIKTPEGYIRIRAHIVFAVKHDGRYKARCVAGGHLTPPSVESVYSGVVLMRQIRIVAVLAELDDLELYAVHIGNAYIEALTKEKICFTAEKGL